MVDTLDKVEAYEAGKLSEAETIALFQELIDTGLAWKLRGYARKARKYIKSGMCKEIA